MVLAPAITWEPLPADYILPDDPVDNIQQPLLAHALNDALDAAGWLRPEMLIAINMGVVATVWGKLVVKAPDWFYVPQVQPVAEGVIRRSYTPHAEGQAVAVVMEFLSESKGEEFSRRGTFPYGKLYFYEQILQVPVYVIYDPYRCGLTVRYWQEGRYVLGTPNPQGRFWLADMRLYLGLWTGERMGYDITWLRWWDASGNLLLWPGEQAAQERQRAELAQQQAAQEWQRAELAQQQATQERQRAELAQQQAEQERQRAELAQQQAEQERQRAAQLALKLRELGVNSDEL